MAQLTLDLADSLVRHAGYLGQATHRDAATVLAETLEMMWPAWKEWQSSALSEPHPNPDTHPSLATLSDEEVLRLADMKMEPEQNERLGELRSKGKNSGLTPTEQVELMLLIQLYQIGRIRKSEGLAEAVRRGLRGPLSS